MNKTFYSKKGIGQYSESLITLETDAKGICLTDNIPFVSLFAGRVYENGTAKSFLKEDEGKPYEETIFKRMRDNNYPLVMREETIKIDGVEWHFQDYYIQYYNPNHKFFWPTKGQIVRGPEARAELEYEIELITSDEYICNLYIPIQTGGRFCDNTFSAMNTISEMFDDFSLLAEANSFAEFDPATGKLRLLFSNDLGECEVLEFTSSNRIALKDLVVSIRLISNYSK